MDHQDAIRQSSVERYILGEISGGERESFEEHMFECALCTEDLRLGVEFLEASRPELVAPVRVRADVGEKRKHRFGLFGPWLNPVWLAPALAASLVAVVYESAVVIPRVEQQLARAESPAILPAVTLAAGATRSEASAARHVHAPEGGSFLVSFDIPTKSTFSAYRCLLYSPRGAVVWHGQVTAEAARDTVSLRVPVAATEPGVHRLTVEGVSGADAGPKASPELLNYKFDLRVEK